ncbi:(d)CMP kinase [Treponema putidum]|uniref:Cytidylate kinase n=1 Tax=Treponema putidum TaxID=221027 RepID=A0AAE9MSS4_9SPIR|nr:AAA family ATPase [Treponema putidum]AIN94125.1 cytidylate kinase [Treponema putidum]TWI79580.1 cytidylate kinase [Treponema putidum]UTY28071.1 cytidylate kinase [Treponema putidum]UTY30570.1 cytidylate kinase [Treponema putidum]UTY32977.1 cytidylate kinase [Treponema putidum]
MKKVCYKIPEGRELRIAISGPSGCGNTTVSTLTAKALNLPCINYTFKNIAEELNMSFEEVLKRAQKDFSFDKMVDEKQIELASSGPCVLGSRLAIWLLKSADLKVYLRASIDVRAKRIQKREGGDIEKIKADTDFRDMEDTRRYKLLYGIDNTKYEKADLIIDTDNLSPEKILEKILEELYSRGLLI